MPITIDGDGTITGVSVGGLPDGIVDTDMLAASAVTEAKLASDPQQGLAKAWVNFDGTGSITVPQGTTAERPTGVNGMFRYNSDDNRFEGYLNNAWGAVGGGATGGGSDTWAVEHDNTITTSYTIGTGKNVISAGPLTVNSGATVTVPSGSTWTIV